MKAPGSFHALPYAVDVNGVDVDLPVHVPVPS